MSPGSERHMHVVIMEQHAPYPSPVLRPSMFSTTAAPGQAGPWHPPPNTGPHGLWSPAAPPGPWYGGWYQWGSQHGYQQDPHMQQYGGPRHYGHSQHVHEGNGCHGNQEHKKRKKKEPIYSHFCDTCDRGFKNEEKYEEHVMQHVKCQEADCNFRAHEKLVQFHWRNMHGPGAKRIKLDTPDEINKWREERRKNYPTLQNIAKKNHLQKAKEDRGDVLKTAQFGKMKGMRNGPGGAKDKSSWKNHQHAKKMRTKFRFDEAAKKDEPVKQKGNSVVPSKEPLTRQSNEQTVNPLDMLAGSDPGSDSGEEPTSSGLTVIPKQVTSGLRKLISSYGSATESDSEPEELPIKTATKAIEENRQILEAHMASKPVNVKAENTSKVANTDSCSAALQPKVPYNKGRTNKGCNMKKPINTKSRTTLLEMLLARDIRHERNVILQCVKYVVQNNFFDCPLKSELPVTSYSSPAKPDLNGVPKSNVQNKQDRELDEKKMSVTSSFFRQLEPVDDEIWETNKTFGELPVTSDSSPAKPKDVTGETKAEVESRQDGGLEKAPVTSSFLRQLEPVDDEIWETNACCVETFGI
ncbi:FMR1-interacting protein NUFIP1 [Rhinoderma darwinii]|uniref:FMR1-interacting protein NUFIP1 n=1 Tax=Rhinoderma darwinii TaxID=43563 RepID=UPI003F6712C4